MRKRYELVDKPILDIYPIKIGDEVIVIDGSYMLNEFGVQCNGIDFLKDGRHEILVVVEINTPRPTDIKGENSLRYYNNCTIVGADGIKYYCSKINIRRFIA